MDHKPLTLFLCLALPSLAQAAFDPLTVGIGSRAIGLGKATTALVLDGDTIFNNPAGLGEIDDFKFTSMAGNLLEDLNYTVIGGVFPLGNQTALGVGYVGSFVSGLEIRDIAGTFSRKANFNNSALVASFGKTIASGSSLGINLKYFSNDGTEIDSGDGQGWNADIGFLRSDLGWLSFGLLGQNVFSFSKLRYQNGEEEALPLTLKGGAKFYLMGEGYQAAFPAPLELTAMVDSAFDLQKSKLPALSGGIEFSPDPLITFRAGIDRTDLSSGLTIKYAGLGFHYALQTQAQYFSVTFDERGWANEEKPDVFFAGR